MPRKLRLLLITLGLLLVVVLLSVLLGTSGQTTAPHPLPNPNGYDELVKANEAVVGMPSSFSGLNQAGLRAMVSTNAEALRLVHLGLSRACAIPLEMDLTNANGIVLQTSMLKRLAYLVLAEGRLLESENRLGEAAHCYTEVIRLGDEGSRGGLLIHRLVGVSCERIGCGALVLLVPKLNATEARGVIADLERIDAHHIAWAETVENEKEFVRHNLRSYRNPLYHLVTWWSNWRMLRNSEGRHNKVVAQERLLAMELALHCCQAERHPLPVRLDGLVTNYFSRLPVDPFNQQPFVYTPRGTNWLLYSVGPDGVDHGGRRSSVATQGKGDIFFDSP